MGGLLWALFCPLVNPPLLLRMGFACFMTRTGPQIQAEIWLWTHSGWCFGTFFIFPYIGNVIIPIDELIFFRGVGRTNQHWKHDDSHGESYQPKFAYCETRCNARGFSAGEWELNQWKWVLFGDAIQLLQDSAHANIIIINIIIIIIIIMIIYI